MEGCPVLIGLQETPGFYYRFAPQLGHRVAPAGMLAPQFLQVMPIDPIGAEPIGIDELIIGGGCIPPAIAGPFPKKALTWGLIR